MGTFTGHIAPGLAFSFLGLWHTLNTIRDFNHTAPSAFRAKPWHPLPSPSFPLKNLELLLLLCFSLLAIAAEALDYPLLSLSFKPNNFEHATIFLHLALFSGAAMAAAALGQPPVADPLTALLASSVFGQELFLLHFHSADHVGPEGHYHRLLQLIVAVSLLSSLALACFPASFPMALLRSLSILFQGCWFADMGLMLWVPRLVAEGCSPRLNGDDVRGAVVCGSEEAKLRFMALANLQFSWILAAILVFAVIACLCSAGRLSERRRSSEYERLQSMNMGQILLVAGGVKGKQQSPSPGYSVNRSS